MFKTLEKSDMANAVAYKVIGGTPRRPAMVRPDGSQEPFPFYFAFGPGERVLDVGCGPGFHLRELVARGCDAVGVEPFPELVQKLQSEGLPVVLGAAEKLPFPSESVDGIVASGMIPMVDERKAVAEWARVLKPGGRVRTSCHGVAFSLEYMFERGTFWRRLYGTRTLINTWYYCIVGRRMPYLGDSTLSSSRRSRKYYRQFGLEVLAEYRHPGLGGYPRYIYHELRKA